MKILYWVVLGAEAPSWPEFSTEEEAEAYADEHGGDVYPVVDVKVIE